MPRFTDRPDAGRQLAKRLQRLSGRTDVLVVGLSRGAMPVAFEVARLLRAPLEPAPLDTFVSSQGAGPARGSVRSGLSGLTLVVVSDVLSSELEIAAFIGFLRAKSPARIIVAAPVGAADVCARVRCIADDCVVALAPYPLRNAGAFFGDESAVEVAAPVLGAGPLLQALAHTEGEAASQAHA